MKKKIFSTLFIIGIVFSSNVNVQALPTNLDSMDYVQQKIYIEDFKKSSEGRLVKIEEEKIENETILYETRNEMVNLKKEIQAKTSINNKAQLSVNNQNLKMWEVVLNSNSFSDMMNNFSLMKTKKNIKDKSLSIVEQQETILIEKYTNAEENLKSLELEKVQLIEDISSISTLEADLQKKMERKNGDIVFNPNDLLKPSNMSVDDMYKVLEGTSLYELAPVYIEAENTYGVNALFIAGLTAEESGWGTSKRAVEDNNLTGLGVYSDSSTGINAHTKRDNILMTTKQIKNNYLTSGGSYYNGFSIQAVNTRYCIGKNGQADYNWSKKITNIATGLLDKVNR